MEGYLVRQKKYDDHNHIFGDRNSFSKSDKGATFMRLKEDHMRNGQLKPAHNAALAVDAEYIVLAKIFQERNDTNTFIPMMEELLPLGYTQPVADSGYESEENYTWCENNGQLAFIKPANHERAKTRKYKSATSADVRICPTTKKAIHTFATPAIKYRRWRRKGPNQKPDTP